MWRFMIPQWHVWFFNDAAEADIIDLLGRLDCGKIVDTEEMKQLRVYFPHDRFGQVYFLMNEGIQLNPSFMGLKPIPGMHGYHPDAPHSYSVMLSNQSIPPDIHSITDIRKTMESELVK
jgi:hypothetical protein